MPNHLLTVSEAREAYHACLVTYLDVMKKQRAGLASPCEVNVADEATQHAVNFYMEALRYPVKQLEFDCAHK